METTKKRGFAYGYILQIDVLLMFFLFAALTNDLFNVFPSMLKICGQAVPLTAVVPYLHAARQM